MRQVEFINYVKLCFSQNFTILCFLTHRKRAGIAGEGKALIIYNNMTVVKDTNTYSCFFPT